MKVFLGGTCNGSTWRDELMPMLDEIGVEYYYPIVPEWTPECQAEELRQREECDFCLYVITPRMTGVYSIAEVIDDSNKQPLKTIFCFLPVDGEFAFTEAQLTSLEAVGEVVVRNGGRWFDGLSSVADFLCSEKERIEKHQQLQQFFNCEITEY